MPALRQLIVPPVAAALLLAFRPTDAGAKRVFLFSVLYLPLLLGFLALDVWLGL